MGFDPLADLSVKEYILDFDQQNEVNVTNTVTNHTVKLNKMTEKVSKPNNRKRKIRNKEISSPLKRKKDENLPKLNCDFCEFVSSEKSILIEHIQAQHFKVEENEIDIPHKDMENKDDGISGIIIESSKDDDTESHDDIVQNINEDMESPNLVASYTAWDFVKNTGKTSDKDNMKDNNMKIGTIQNINQHMETPNFLSRSPGLNFDKTIEHLDKDKESLEDINKTIDIIENVDKPMDSPQLGNTSPGSKPSKSIRNCGRIIHVNKKGDINTKFVKIESKNLTQVGMSKNSTSQIKCQEVPIKKSKVEIKCQILPKKTTKLPEPSTVPSELQIKCQTVKKSTTEEFEIS